jgi:hypothetical protein
MRLYGKLLYLTVKLGCIILGNAFWFLVDRAAGWLRDHNPFGGIRRHDG